MNTITISFVMNVKSPGNLDQRILKYFKTKVLPNVPMTEGTFKNLSMELVNTPKLKVPVRGNLNKEKASIIVKDVFRTKAVRFVRKHNKEGVTKYFGVLPPVNIKSKNDVELFFDSLINELKEKGVNVELIQNESGVRSLVVQY